MKRERKDTFMRGLIENKITDFVSDYVAVENRAEATELAHQALAEYDQGTLTSATAQTYIDKMLTLVRPEMRPKLEKRIQKNRSRLDRMLR